MLCSKCGAPMAEGDKFCTKCGAPAVSMYQRQEENTSKTVICRFCGKTILRSDRFCQYCGKPVEPDQQNDFVSEFDIYEDSDSETGRQYTEADEKTTRKTITRQAVVLLSGIVVLVIMAIVLVWKLTGGSDNTLLTASSSAVSGISSSSSTAKENNGKTELNEEDFKSDGSEKYSTDVFSFSLPSYWKNLCEKDSEDTFISFRQKKSSEEGYDGTLFTIAEVDSSEIETIEGNYELLKQDGDFCYVVIYPDNKTYNTEDEYTKLEYERLLKDVSYIKQSFELADMQGEDKPEEPEGPETEGDYIIADSNSRYITRDDLTGLSPEQIRIARNEIYARKGRRFNDASLQSYFDSKSWYNGTISPYDFNDGMLNDFEKKNAELIRAYENENGINQ